MKTIGAFDAKTHLSALLEKVARGESFLITKRGKPIAALSPVTTGTQHGPKELIADFRQRFARSLKSFTTEEIIALKEARQTMKGLVIDASVAASWLLADELSPYAERVLDAMQRGEPAFVPSLWPLEIANVLFNAERRKRIDKKHRDAALDRIEHLPISILSGPALADLKTIRTLAEKHQLTAYDAEYLRVAAELKLPLATQDGNLIAAAKREKMPVF